MRDDEMVLISTSEVRAYPIQDLHEYPKRLFLVCIVVLGSAVFLEFTQTLTPDRHGRLLDATQKLLGGSVGILVGLIVLYLTPRSWFEI
jgi:VanZ family protein